MLNSPSIDNLDSVQSTGRGVSRRSILTRIGAVAGTAVTVSLAGCTSTGADHASYWSESRQLNIDYDAVLTAARDTGYTVDEPYYVGTKEARGVRPDGFADFDNRFGPEYRVFGFTFFPTEYIFVEFWLTDETPTVTLIDDRGFEEFPVESLPPDAWLLNRLTLAFDVSETTARDHMADFREQVTEGTSTPSIDVDAPVSFPRVYEAIETERTDASGSETGGDGWYKETSYQDDNRYATVDIIVQSTEIRHENADRTYTIKLDRLGGFYVTIRLPVGEEIPEDDYRQVFKDIFDDIGLPTEVVDDLAFEYAGSIW